MDREEGAQGGVKVRKGWCSMAGEDMGLWRKGFRSGALCRAEQSGKLPTTTRETTRKYAEGISSLKEDKQEIHKQILQIVQLFKASW